MDSASSSSQTSSVVESRDDLQESEDEASETAGVGDTTINEEKTEELEAIEEYADEQAEKYFLRFVNSYGNPFSHPTANQVASPNYLVELGEHGCPQHQEVFQELLHPQQLYMHVQQEYLQSLLVILKFH